MINGNGVSTMGITENAFDLNSLLQKESIVDVEVPIKGLLLKESVVVCDASPGQIEAHTSNISHFCTGSYDYPLFLKLNRTNKALACRLSDIVVYTGKLVMKDFHMMEEVWVNRECERVQPKEPIFVSVTMGKQKFNANLFDLSLTGMCILTDKKNFKDPRKLYDKKMTVSLQLPNSQLTCKIKGTAVQVRTVSDSLLRIGMNINMLKKDYQVVSHYLSERKREILDELFINFLQLLNYRETKDQYF